MDEEQMWKGFFEKLQDIKSNPTTEHESIIQNSDGGFFEKFGYLLRQKSKIEESESKPALAPFSIEESSKESIELGKTHPEEEEGSSQEFKKDEFITVENNVLSDHFIQGIVGMNVEDLYEEILFEILNNVGYNSTEVTSDGLIEFAQDVFKIPIKKHVEILKYAQAKEPPKLRLNIEVIKAENLVPKDSNGLSDPFVTLYLESHSSHRYNSSVKPRTLDPVWEEHFSLPIAENLKNEVLIIEVWDFDAAETVKEKVNKILDVRGVKGLRKLMKEIAVTASTGKHDNELIGKSAIILKAIPTSGFTGWYNLEKKTKTKSRGSLLVSLTLSAEKNKNVAIQEHRHLLQLLLMYELESSQVRNFWWSGKFSANGEALRSQHAVQSGLSTYECALSQWIAYSIIHESHHLSFNLFNSILDILLPNLKYQNSEDVKNFWDAAKRLLPSCFSVIRKIRSKNTSDKTILKIIVEVLDILSKIKSMQIPETCNLFPSSVYGWIDTTSSHCSINDIVKAAIIATTKEWMEYIIEGSKSGKKIQTDEEQLQYLIKIVQMVRADLQKASEYFDKHFNKKIQLNYSEILFCYYDMKLCEISKPIVIKVCSNIKRLQVPDDQFEYLPNIDDINMGTTLFELYLILKRFLEFGTNLCSTDVVLEMESYYHWFMPGVTHWLDISIIKALNRIQKAIELDKLKPVDETVKFSSSAVDTLAIFYQIKIFWEQLAWPDIEGSYTFVAKIIDDVCRCCVFYAQTISRRLENLEIDDRNSFIVSSEWCLAINNIDYIRQSLPSFIKELNVDEIIRKLGEYRSNLEADRCAVTVKNVIDNALDTERNQILELLEIITKKMAPSMQRFLTEGAEVLHENSNSMEKLMAYLEKSLAILYEFLNEINFGRILDAIWAELSVVLYDLIKSSLDKRRPPAFFQNLRKTLNIMISSFKIGSIVSSDIEVLSEIERILELHALETADLIHQYYLDRYKNTCDTSEFGQLTITADFTQDVLILKILNARNLLPMDTNGSCDSFVKIHLLPSSRFPGQGPFKTSTRLKTRFPLFDETFNIPITEEQRSDGSNLLLFSIKDKDLFGMTNQYIAECYVTFEKLLSTGNIQIHLTLSRPEYADSDIIRALEHRQGDKQAKEFIKKLKNKSS